MKIKLPLLLLAPLLFGACTASNKNLLVQQTDKYPAEKYITKIAFAANKNAAKQKALDGIKGIFATLPQNDERTVRTQAILADAYTAQWWQEEGTKQYYALAVLERAKALEVFTPYYKNIDGKLSALQNKIAAEQDKLLRLKNAVLMEPLLKQRALLDEEYNLISFDGSDYDEDAFYGFKSAYAKAFYDIRINLVLKGVDDSTITSAVSQDLTSAGLSSAAGDKNADFEVTLDVKTDAFASETTGGLYWSTATAAVTIKDLRTDSVFAAFNRAQRIGAGRKEDAVRRSILAIGQACGPEIKVKLSEYIESK